MCGCHLSNPWTSALICYSPTSFLLSHMLSAQFHHGLSQHMQEPYCKVLSEVAILYNVYLPVTFHGLRDDSIWVPLMKQGLIPICIKDAWILDQ